MTRTLTYGAAALIAAASCSAAASAADLPVRTAPPSFVTPILASGWDGFYAGSTYGYGFTNFHTTTNGVSRNKTESGQSGGGLVGYNFQTGHFVYGVEGGIDLNVIRGTVRGSAPFAATRLDSLDDIRFRGRIGYEFGWIMPFIAGGAVINETYQSGLDPANYGQVKRTVGYTIGGGVDVKFNPRTFLPFLPDAFFGPLILRAEYLHDSLPRETYAYGPIGGASQKYRTESDTNLIRLAIIYRFGETAPRPYADSLGNVNWAGGYGGVFGGYGSSDVRSRFGGTRTTTSADGGLGGLYAGSNFMFFNNKVMLGFDGSTSFRDFTGTGSEPYAPGNRTSVREYVQADIRGRVGYAFGNFLPFVAAGVSFTRSEQKDLATGSEVGRIPADNFTVGGGLDYRISQRVSLRGEYLYETSFSNKTVSLNGVAVKQDRDANVVRFGAAYHFE